METTKVETKIFFSKFFNYFRSRNFRWKTVGGTGKDKWKKRVLNKQKDSVNKSGSGSYLSASRFQ